MPQQEAKFQINKFTAGLVTDANPLEDAGPISIDEDNCEIMYHGGRRRRRGAGLEPGAVLASTVLSASEKQDFALSTHEWNAVAGVPNLEFVVQQEGDKLWFYDKGFSILSLGRKSFSVDLQTFRTAAASSTDVENTLVSVATGKGVIFVCGAAIEPFYVEYNPTLDTITTTQVTIQIRDFEEQSPEIGPKDEVTVAPATTGQHLYDLLNQGWYQKEVWARFSNTTFRGAVPVIELYRANPDSDSNLPRKNTPWHFGKYIVANGESSNQYFSAQTVRSAPSGNTLAPFGHYILDAFNKDRRQAVIDAGDDFTATYGIADLNDLDPEVEDERPVACAFYAGRVWWALKNDVYFSQLLDEDTLELAGRCYQAGDPTSEGESDVVATDGGVIPVQNMGLAVAMGVTGVHLIIAADNGVWSVSGTGGSSFSAVDYSVNRLSTASFESPLSLVEAEGIVFLWGETGIYAVSPSNVAEYPELKDLVEGRVTQYYNAIPQASKRDCFGVYDPSTKIIHWMYKASADSEGIDTNRFAYDRFLNFSLKFSAFFPWSVDATSTEQISGGTISSGIVSSYQEEAVVDSSGEDVVDSNGATVVVNRLTTSEVSSKFKPVVLSDNALTFGEFFNTTFLDWDDGETGVNYSSFIETFYHIQDDYMAQMQAPYLYTYWRRTEDSLTPTGVAAGFSYDSLLEGGLTLDATFLYNNAKISGSTSLQSPDFPSTAGIVEGLDGEKYSFVQGWFGVGTDSDDVRLYRISDGVQAFELTPTDIRADADALGLTPPGGWIGGTYDGVTCFAVPSTPYFIVISRGSAGVDSGHGVFYYRIEDDSTLTLVGGYNGGEDNLTAGPTAANSSSYNIIGLYTNPDYQVTLPASNDYADSHSGSWFEYPISLAYQGSGGVFLVTIPAINDIVLSPLNLEDSTTIWQNKTDTITGIGNPFNLTGTGRGERQRSDGFILPTPDNETALFIKWYQPDIDEHIAGTEATTNTFLQTHDSTYPDGFITSVAYDQAIEDGWGFANVVGATTVNAAEDWSGFPFTDETDNFDGSSGTSDDNYYMNAAAYPIYPDNVYGPWALFFPKVFRSNSSDAEKLLIRVLYYDPLTGRAKHGDVLGGQVLDLVADIGDTDSRPNSAAVYWDQTTKELYAQIHYSLTGVTSIATVKFGEFVPVVASANDFYAGSTSTIVESSCLLNTRWEWANHTNSGKVSRDLQVYRTGRPLFGTAIDAPITTGLPVYVSKTKIRGRGRALQLRFRSEEGKDFELYGWGVWSAKNTRF